MLNFEFKFDFEKIEKGLIEKIERTEDLRPVMNAISLDMLKEVQLNFRGEKTPEGDKWIPSKRALRDNGKTLRDKGTLQKSINARYNNTSAKVGTNVTYAAIHQFGSAGLGNGVIKIKNRTSTNIYYSNNEKKNILARTSKRKANFVYSVSINVGLYGIVMPSREFLGINWLQRERYKRMVTNYLLHGKVIIGR